METNTTRTKRSIPGNEDTLCPELDLKLMKFHIMKKSVTGGLYNSGGSTIKVNQGPHLKNLTIYHR